MTNVVDFMPQIDLGEDARQSVRRLTTDQIKRAWTAWDQIYEPKDKGDFILQALHEELNVRGEGAFCAV